jgi:hypothetical protein
MHTTIEHLKYISGIWTGKGIAEFPTINTFEYSEHLTFAFNEKNPVIHFEQKAWIKSNNERNNEPISWESGFIIDKGNNLFELICTHNSGRLEWYKGFAEQITNDKIIIEFDSVAIINDDRMISSKRVFIFNQTSIGYEQLMNTSKVKQTIRHLKAELFNNKNEKQNSGVVNN